MIYNPVTYLETIYTNIVMFVTVITVAYIISEVVNSKLHTFKHNNDQINPPNTLPFI